MEKLLCATLRPGDIVVMDNLGAHKSSATLDPIRAAGAEPRFLPAYSPDLNPIEKMWSKITSLLRSAEARTPEELDETIGMAPGKVTPEDHRGWCFLWL